MTNDLQRYRLSFQRHEFRITINLIVAAASAGNTNKKWRSDWTTHRGQTVKWRSVMPVACRTWFSDSM